jgi:hypothetical protein
MSLSLKDEILARQDCADAVAARDLDALAALVSAGRTTTRRVPIEDVQARLQSTLEWWAIKQAAATPGHSAFLAAMAVTDVAGARYANIDMALPAVDSMFQSLVADGLMSQATMDDIAAMSVVPAPVSRRDVEAALFNSDGSLK